MTITFVTSNPYKFAEAQSILKEFGVKISWKKQAYPEIRSDDVREIAAASVEGLKDKVKGPFFVEDAGLFIDVLEGFPGQYSAWVLKKLGNPGILKLMRGGRKRAAEYRSAIALFDGKLHVFDGVVKGSIASKEKGTNGFGFDPLFIPRGYGKTFGELDERIKNRISHRRMALERMAKYLLKRGK